MSDCILFCPKCTSQIKGYGITGGFGDIERTFHLTCCSCNQFRISVASNNDGFADLTELAISSGARVVWLRHERSGVE